MSDAKLTPRQLADALKRIEEIEKHSKAVRQLLIESMAERRREPPSAWRRLRRAAR